MKMKTLRRCLGHRRGVEGRSDGQSWWLVDLVDGGGGGSDKVVVVMGMSNMEWSIPNSVEKNV